MSTQPGATHVAGIQALAVKWVVAAEAISKRWSD